MQQVVYRLATDVLWLLGYASMQASQVSLLKHTIAHHTLVNNRTDKGCTQSPCIMIQSCWHALLKKLSMHSSGNKLTHTCTAQYSSNPHLGVHCSRAHQSFVPLIVISVQMGIENGSMSTLSQTRSCRQSAKPVRQSSSDSHGQLHPDAGSTL